MPRALTEKSFAQLALALVLSSCTQQSSPADRSSAVAPSVVEALSRTVSVRALISTDGIERAHAIAAALPGARTFHNVPAIAADLTSSQLAWVRRQEGIQGIALDQAGVGHLHEALPLAGFTASALSTFTGAGTLVAIIDSGIDRAHPDLADAVLDEACFCSSGCCPGGETTAFGTGSAFDDSGHGTHVAGIVASRGATTGQPGGAPGARIIAIKVLDEHNTFCCISDVVAALDWLSSQHPDVDVVNMSFGANGLHPSDCDAELEVAALSAAVGALTASGTVFVASSGNNGVATGLPAPACIADVISVGAVWDDDLGPEAILCSEPETSADRIACFSNASPTLDLLAPGAVVTSTWPDGLTLGRAGTSQAAPMVSACAAILRQAAPSATPERIASALKTSPTLLLDTRNDEVYPRLDCGAALRALIGIDGGMNDAGSDDGGSAQDAEAPLGDAGDSGSSEDSGTASDAGDDEPPDVTRDAGMDDSPLAPDAAAEAVDASAPGHPTMRDAGLPRDGGESETVRMDATAGDHDELPPERAAACGCEVASAAKPERAGLILGSLVCALALRRSRRRSTR